jgi:hypothetical protein
MSKELEQAIREFKAPTPVVLEYRLYYDTNGKPISMSSHNHPAGDYIVIPKDVYDRANYNYRVVNGKLESLDQSTTFRVQLRKSTSGMPVVAGHASLPIEPNEEYTDIEYYDRNN